MKSPDPPKDGDGLSNYFSNNKENHLMRFFRFLATIIVGTSLCLIGYQSAFAQGMGMGTDAPANPESSVEGRTYCMVLTQLRMRSPGVGTAMGMSFGIPAELQSQVVRRKATFSGGVIEGEFLSRTRNTQNADTGAVTHLIDPGFPADLMGTYVQTGNKLDVIIPFGTFSITATWYVSGDGSVIHGALNAIRPNETFGMGGIFEADLGVTRNWTLVESNTCDAEGFLTEL